MRWQDLRVLVAAVLLLVAGCRSGEEQRQFAAAEKAYRGGDHEGALRAYRAVLDRDPESLRALHGSALVHYSSERYDQALYHLDRMLALDPQRVEGHLLRGNTLIRLERHDDAIGAYETARELDPTRAETYYALGMAHYNNRQYETAASWLRHYLTMDPHASNADRVREMIGYLEE